jgi:AmiR/NasT family two-component response regulator
MLQEWGSASRRSQVKTDASGAHNQPKAAGELNVALIVELDTDGEHLMRELQRLRCTVRHIWPVPPQIPEGFDVVYCSLVEDLPRRIPWLPGEPAAALVIVDRGREQLNLKLIHHCAAHGLVHMPVTARSTAGSLAMAREHFLYEQRLRGRIEKLDENMRTMRTVERAKLILMRVKNLGEEDAYNYLRNQAMERRVTIGAVANAIIDSHELLS